MEFHPIIQQGVPEYSDTEHELRMRYLTSMKDGTQLREKWTKLGPQKTYQQVKTIFGLVIAMIIDRFEEYGWDSSVLLHAQIPTGVPVSKTLLKEYFYAVCPIDNDGACISLSSATIEQARQFIDDTRNYAASQWGIHIPDPDPNWQQKIVGAARDAAQQGRK